MYTKQKSIWIGIMLILIIGFISCSKKSDNPVEPPVGGSVEAKLTLNGAGYTNQQVSLKNGISGYYINDNETYIQFIEAAGADTVFFALVFSGKQTGSFPWSASAPVVALIVSSGSSNETFLSSGTGSTNVSAYGNVGGAISGNLSGTMTEATSSANLQISGTFTVTRGPDSSD